MEELNSKGFDPEKFLRSHWGPDDDVRKLQVFRGKVQGLADETAQIIKKNVFQNYSQFIETSNEISYLEREMYQLNHLLTEQKNLIERMMNLSFTGSQENKAGDRLKAVDDRRKSVQQLLDKVEGCNHLAENSQRYIVFDSDLTELNPESCAPIRQVHAFLLDDGLMMTSWIPHRLGAIRYRYEAMYQLESLAVKNIEDSVGVKNAFKLTVFPEYRTYQCENQKLKRKWLDAIDLVKRQMLREGSLMRQATIRMKKEKEVQSSQEHGTRSGSEDHANSTDAECDGDWLRELPDELDVCIAQRDFTGAIDIIFEAREYLQEAGGSVLVQEAKEKICQRENQLVELLCTELKSCGEQALQGGPKGARRAIGYLVKLGKSSKACDLYLKNRSVTIKQALRELKIVDVTVTFVQQLTRIVFTHLIDAGKDFTKLFADSPGCLSVLLLWASGELKNYVNQLLRHVFDPGPTLSVIGQCVKLARSHVEHLSEIGLDLEFELDKLLCPHIQKVIEQNRENFMEALRLRIDEDKWKPHNSQSESGLAKFLEEMKDLGLNLEPYVLEQTTVKSTKDRCFLWLTPQTCHFARAIMPFLRDLGILRFGDQQELTDSALISVWRLQLTHLNKSELAAPHAMLQKNAEFLRNYLLPICENKYMEAAKTKDWHRLNDLLKREFAHMPGELEEVGDV